MSTLCETSLRNRPRTSRNLSLGSLGLSCSKNQIENPDENQLPEVDSSLWFFFPQVVIVLYDRVLGPVYEERIVFKV